jgi:hypothetical protein
VKLFANITNEAIAKLFSVEFIGGLITAIFIAGIFWNSITGSIAEALEASDDNKHALAELAQDVTKVKTDIEVIKRSQDDYQKYQKEVQQNQTQELRDIKAALTEISRESRAYRAQGD